MENSCKNAENCHYAHGNLELRFHLFYKTFMCKNAENCNYGYACAYAHSENEIRTFAKNLNDGANVPPAWMQIPKIMLNGYKTALCRWSFKMSN